MRTTGAREVGDAESARLASRVVCLSCLTLCVTVLLNAIPILLIVKGIDAIPNSYGDFSAMCADGKLPDDICEQAKQQLQEYCSKQNPPPTTQECHAQFDKAIPTIKLMGTVALGIGFIMMLCCSACVPICGFIGAKQHNSGCLLCFLIMNGLQIVLGIYAAVQNGHAWTALLSIILPGVCFYYGYLLHQRQVMPPQVHAPFITAAPAGGRMIQPLSHLPSAPPV